MTSPDRHTPAEMSWVDYCDSLSTANFVLRVTTPPPQFAAKSIPDHTEFMASVREAVRDLK